jgi:hypothetical protein
VQAFHLTGNQAARLQRLVRHYGPQMGKSWRKCTEDELWLRVVSQVVVAGNAAPGYVLLRSEAAKRILSYSRLKKLSLRRRRKTIHTVLQAIGTRYVGKSTKNRKIDAALHNFDALVEAGGPKKFFQDIAAMKTIDKKIEGLATKLAFYKKKGCRDTLIELRLGTDCLALDQRLRNIMECVGAKVPKSIDRHYDEIEKELITTVAKPCGLSGGELDRILFQNYGDIMVRLKCA